jgi:copper chaperone CopZ
MLLAICTVAAAQPGFTRTAHPKKNTASAKPALQLHRLTFSIEGSSCLSCIRRIERLIRLTDGVKNAELEFRYPVKATVVYDPKKVTIAKITDYAKRESTTVLSLKDQEL